jgi:stearoyl-CoA desaturase (delta-9 desaturase)
MKFVFMAAILIFFTAHWYLSLFSQSFFDHRYAAHGAFKMNRFWEKFFYVFAYITQGASYMSPRAYAIMHRMHHAYTDTAKDPHSPQYAKGVISMMKRTNSFYIGIYKKTFPVEQRFLKNVPDWPWFDKWAMTYTSSAIWTLLYIGYYIYFAPSLWWFLLIPIHVLMGPVHGTIVNWIAHKYGYRNFELSNTSRNIMPVDLFMMGEGYHNNHHKFASSANFGYRWYEIDPTYLVMRVLHALHVIRINTTSFERRVTVF